MGEEFPFAGETIVIPEPGHSSTMFWTGPQDAGQRRVTTDEDGNVSVDDEPACRVRG